MKKAVYGIRYDTENATKIGSFDNLGSRVFTIDQQGHWQATLYRSPRAGNYFLAGSGGPMSRWRSKGADLHPLTDEEALAWAREYLSDEEIARYFPGKK